MVRIMICGSRKEEDIERLVSAGVSGIGLITEVWQEIACNLSRQQAGKLCSLIPPFVCGVLIITQEDVEEICAMVQQVRPDVLQLHGFNAAEDIATLKKRLNIRITKTLHFQGDKMAEGDDPAERAREFVGAGASAIVLDSYSTGRVGATGEKMSLATARRIRDAIKPVPVILAGGLDPDNVAQAIEEVQPYAVDVYSGVVSDGYLDFAKVKMFIDNALMRSGSNKFRGRIHDVA